MRGIFVFALMAIHSRDKGEMSKTHDYSSRLVWNGNLGAGTSTYSGYGRDYTVMVAGKPDMRGSADPMFRGSRELHNPEDLFVASISSCHMLSYLALCARQGVSVIAYEDNATGTLALDEAWNGRFEQVTLNPVVTIADGDKEALALAFHDEAHRSCFIASSCSVPIHHLAKIRVAKVDDSRA